jgi:hypothetical protein
MQKIDFKKALKHLYLPAVSKTELVNSKQSYREAVEALFILRLAYTVSASISCTHTF